MNRRNFLSYTASSAGILLPAMHCLATSARAAPLSAFADNGKRGEAPPAILEDEFRGVDDGYAGRRKKLYPDSSRWALSSGLGPNGRKATETALTGCRQIGNVKLISRPLSAESREVQFLLTCVTTLFPFSQMVCTSRLRC